MLDRSVAISRPQSPGEEIANSVSHGLAFLGAIVMLPLLVSDARPHGTAAVVGVSVFATSLMLLYLASTLYHALGRGNRGHLFRIIDHSAIYVLIAGTYTPFTLGVLRGSWGWSMFAVVWTLAAIGIAYKILGGFRHPRFSTGLYLGMGWIVLVAAKPLGESLAPWGLFWLVAGGVAYTAGVGFFATDRHRYRHFVWHLFVMAGSACHVVAVWRYAN